MDDIRPHQPQSKPEQDHKPSPSGDSLPPLDPLPPRAKQPRASKKRLTIVLTALGAFLLAATISTFVWYSWALRPLSSTSEQVRIMVQPGDTAAIIAANLDDHELIRSRLAFTTYVQLSGNRSKLQAGGYVLAPNMSIQRIVEHMTGGETDELDITIPPGLTLKQLRSQFIRNGFSDEEVTRAFDAEYDHPLLASRPAGATLEGYIYPETYRINADQPLDELLKRSFDELYEKLQTDGILAAFAGRGLTIHQGLTLASMVQKEVADPADQKQVAQVFLKRLAEGIQLGSDVTFIYVAEELGVEATPALDSPYNTRKYGGLPPGPISNMNPSAIDAVAAPAAGDFLYFVAGDDGVTYFSRTEAEHEANVRAHCTTLCQ